MAIAKRYNITPLSLQGLYALYRAVYWQKLPGTAAECLEGPKTTNVKGSKFTELPCFRHGKQANNSGKVMVCGAVIAHYHNLGIANSENQQKKHNSKVIYGVESALIFLPCIRFLTDKTRSYQKKACRKLTDKFNIGDSTAWFVTGLHIGGIA